MSLLAAISARLGTDATYSAAMGSRIGTTRKFAGLPGSVLETISEQRTQHYKGFQLRQAMVQLDILARDEVEGARLRDLAIDLLTPGTTAAGIRFDRAQTVNVRSGGVLGTQPHPQPIAGRLQAEIHRESIDFIFTYRPA